MNVKRAKVATFKVGEIVTLNYINYLEKNTVKFRIDRLPNMYIPSFTLVEIECEGCPRVKEEIVEYISKYKTKTLN